MMLPRPHSRSRRSGRAGSGNAGFTLIEAMLSVALMIFVIGALGTMTREWLHNWDRGFARVQRVDLWAAGLDRLMADLAAAEYVSAALAIPSPTSTEPNERRLSSARRSAPMHRPRSKWVASPTRPTIAARRW